MDSLIPVIIRSSCAKDKCLEVYRPPTDQLALLKMFSAASELVYRSHSAASQVPFSETDSEGITSPLLLQLMDDPNIVIAKMDATANDVPSPYEVSG